MPEAIYKLQPDRSIYLQGFDAFGAAAAMHSATPEGFTVSGVFRDAADFAVLILWDADCFFEHPSFKYLPDFSLAGLVLSFDVSYTKLQPLDSQKFPTIDWPFLDVALADGSSAQVTLFDHARLAGGSFAAASGTLNVETPGAAAFDSLVVWYQNIAFEFIAVGGETAAEVATAIAALINATNWTEIGGIAALWATTFGAALTITYARYGEVSTNGQTVALSSGQNFAGMAVGDSILIGSTVSTVTATGATTLSVADDLGVQTSTPYLAGRGGEDGNMVTLYAVPKNSNLTTDVSVLTLAGGSSAATWRVTLDFTALGIDQVRQMWLTFAPELANGAAYSSAEWDAVFSNWAVSDPEGTRLLQVAGANSVRIEESDDYCTFAGSGWSVVSSAVGFWSQGFAKTTAHVGDSVTVQYICLLEHNLYLGTLLGPGCGKASLSIDGGAAVTVDCYLNVTSSIATRRLAGSAIAAGKHTVTITLTGSNPSAAGSNFYFDFLEAAVLSDVPDPPEAVPTTSPAIDYDTNHGFQLAPARLMNIFDQLGFTGPLNEYVGVFWWNQRTAAGAVFGSVTVTFGGTFVAGDQVLLFIGTAAPNNNVGKTVFAGDTNVIIAAHLAYFINETFSGVWAAVGEDGGGNSTLTITARSPAPAYNFTFSASTELTSTSTGTAAVTGSLSSGVLPSWVIDPTQSPPVNYAARMWHADLFAQVASRGLSITSSFSMELVNPPDNPPAAVWAARYRDGTAVETATGFGVLNSTQCVPSAPEFLAYQVACFQTMAGLQAAAGLTPEVQFGEHLWWYFTNYSATNLQGGMAYYDSATSASAVASLGRALGIFLTPNDDPSAVHSGTDAAFLAGLLFAHVSSLAAAVKALYPTAQAELLWPYDVNYPMPIGREDLGGRLNFAVNLPVQWKGKAGSNLDRFKIEALDFGSGTRSLDLALKAIEFPGLMGWPLQSIRYLFPVDNGGCPFLYEQQLAQGALIPFLTPFAVDHVCLFGWDLRENLLPEIL
ncbi:MAG TPA: hypothetical protein VK752_05155 [Bryobacteraceae bacterium]|nr:hypothetical protein [Bryobacteraceae bacterium]